MKQPCQVIGSAALFLSAALTALPPLSGLQAREQTRSSPLRDTAWRLVDIRSMDEGQGIRRPPDPSRYTLRLQADGRAVLQLDCNRASGSWTVEPSSDPTNGGFRFGPLATTSALCPPPSLGETLSAQLPAVRGYRLQGGQLSLSLLADGGILLFEPLPAAEVRFSSEADAGLEAAIRQAVPDYRQDMVGGDEERWARYVHAAIDLDDDGSQEVLVYLMGSFFCGTGGCNLQVYRSTAKGYVLVNDFPTSRVPIVISESRNNGWQDLWRLQSGGGAPATYVRHVFDGERYVERERISAAEGMPDGTAVLSGNPTFNDAIPLAPAD